MKSWLQSVAFVVLFAAAPAEAQQASPSLSESDVALGQFNHTAWSLSKTAETAAVASGDTVHWNVEVVKGTTSGNTLAVVGFVRVSNTGTAPATIGNVVVNLQRQRQVQVGVKKGQPQYQNTWVSASVVVADATHGDSAASGKIQASASEEDAALNSQWNNPATYAVSGAQGTFVENVASGQLAFMDANSNSVWSLAQQSVPPSGSVELLFQAEFNNSLLAVPAGESVRVEVLVSFGNSPKGNAAKNIDINGNGMIDSDESKVRTLTSWLSQTVPAVAALNSVVLLTDDGLSNTGDASFDSFDDAGLVGGVLLTDSESIHVSAVVDGGAGGGSVTNTAKLVGQNGQAVVVVGAVHAVSFGTPVNLQATSTVAVAPRNDDPPPPPPFLPGDYITYSQAEYRGDGDAGTLFANDFLYAFAAYGGLFLGLDDGPGSFHFAVWTDDVAGQSALYTFLGGGGVNGAFTSDLVNPTNSSGGVLARQAAVLALNVTFNDTGFMPSALSDFSDLTLCNLQEGSQIGTWTLSANQAAFLNGVPIWLLLDDVSLVLGANFLPPYADSFDELNELVTALNLSFDNGVPSAFALSHLCHGSGGGGEGGGGEVEY